MFAAPTAPRAQRQRSSLGQFAGRTKAPSLYFCKRCDRHLPADAFGKHSGQKNKRHRDGLADYCRECFNGYNKARLRASPEWQAREAKREFRRAQAADLNAPKRCSVCQESKPKSEFWRSRAALDGLYEACRDCEIRRRASRVTTAVDRAQRRARQAERYARDPAPYRAEVRGRCGEVRAWIHGLKSSPCMDCGNSFHPCAMDFDHRPGEAKLFNVSSQLSRSREAIEAEIAKCDLVCSNCHRLRTYTRGTNRLSRT